MKNAKALWCPFGRISIQNWEGGKFQDAVPGSHNLVVIVDRMSGNAGKDILPVSPCQKELCALYKKSPFPGCKGHCGLENSHAAPWIFSALITIEVLAVSAIFILKHLG